MKKKRITALIAAVVLTMALAYACQKSGPAVPESTATPQPASTQSATENRTNTPTVTLQQTATDTPTAGPTGTYTPTATATVTLTPTGTVYCAGMTTGPGNYSRTTVVDGIARDYIVHVPPSYSTSAGVSLILNFHGGTGSALDQIVVSGMNAKSNSAGFIVVYPDGYGNTKTWNAGGCCGEARVAGVDDVKFADRIITEMLAEFCIDPKRVYACGHSNGAMMCQRLACQLSEKIAAICAVGGGMSDVNPDDATVYYNCSPSRPVPVLQMHGLQDGCYPYTGGYGAGVAMVPFVSIPHTVGDWLARNGCGASAVQTYSNGNAACVTYMQGCSQGAYVTLCTDSAAGHCWFGSSVYPSAATCGGAVTTDLIANDAMWDFFQSHPMP